MTRNEGEKMKNKQNPLLASFQAKLEAQHKQRLAIQTEIDLMATMIAANEMLKVGSGRAGFFLAEVLDMKMQIAKEIVDEDDPELLYTKHQLATRLKQIFSKEDWNRYKELFPLLREYWE
jgi:hypothetical protein